MFNVEAANVNTDFGPSSFFLSLNQLFLHVLLFIHFRRTTLHFWYWYASPILTQLKEMYVSFSASTEASMGHNVVFVRNFSQS